MRKSNITKNGQRAALVLVLTATIIGLAPAFATSASAQYSINDVSGSYVDLNDGFTYGDGGSNSKQAVPDSTLGLFTFTPATGTFQGHTFTREIGENFEGHPHGTYTVDANGHGTMTWTTLSGNAKHRDFYIVKGGAELEYIVTDPPQTVVILSNSGTMIKSAGSFSISDVSGNYVDHGDGWTYGVGGPNDKQSVPVSHVALITFMPATRTLHLHFIVREYGANVEDDRNGTYTVDPDGHGTMSWVSLTGSVRHRDFYIVNGGAEIKWINTDPPGTIVLSTSGTMTKQ